jgi:thiol-disulfide isomerase/thioredoxin
MVFKMLNMKNLKKLMSARLYFVSLLVCLSGFKVVAQQRIFEPIKDQKELNRRKVAVEKYPDSLPVHKLYIDGMGILNPNLVKQYDVWLKQYPKSAVTRFAIGDTLASIEQPSAKRYLLEAIKLNPNIAKAYFRLAFDAERWGDFAGSRDYLAKAVFYEPGNPNYNYYYASSLRNFDLENWRRQSLHVVDKFPKHPRAAQALYFLAERLTDREEKKKYLKMLYDRFDEQTSWYRLGMESYLDMLLFQDPDSALNFAREMVRKPKLSETWTPIAKSVEQVAKGMKMIEANQPAQALTCFDAVSSVGRYALFNKRLPLLKAAAIDKMGKADSAYNYLMGVFLKAPSFKINNALLSYGVKLGKDSLIVREEIFKKIYAGATPATDFKLRNYKTNKDVSLADLRGKVVLLTYWFPGCGPCRAEFPHFENVLKQFVNKPVAYIGINIDKRQNEYVVPFLEKSKYSFIALEEQDGRVKGNLDNGRIAPVNFLIDKDGKIIFSRFRTDDTNEDELKTMIEMLLLNEKS